MSNKEENMLIRKSYKEFKDSGLMWFTNTILHMFGWAIVYDNDTKEFYPARCKFRGFDEKSNDKGYRNVSKYLLNNIVDIEKESRE